MTDLQSLCADHATQARQHESQREILTSIAIPVAALLIGPVTYSGMSVWSLPAALAAAALGTYGLLFSGKHYERFKFHVAMTKAIQEEMDRVAGSPDAAPKSISELKGQVERDHYVRFVWPHFRGTRSKPQALATSWIARQRLNMFWEAAHAGIAVLGLLLCLMIIIKAAIPAQRPQPVGTMPKTAAN